MIVKCGRAMAASPVCAETNLGQKGAQLHKALFKEQRPRIRASSVAEVHSRLSLAVWQRCQMLQLTMGGELGEAFACRALGSAPGSTCH